MAYNKLSFIKNKLFYFWFLSFSDWVIIIYRNQLFEVFIDELKCGILNEWDKKQILCCFNQSYTHYSSLWCPLDLANKKMYSVTLVWTKLLLIDLSDELSNPAVVTLLCLKINIMWNQLISWVLNYMLKGAWVYN